MFLQTPVRQTVLGPLLEKKSRIVLIVWRNENMSITFRIFEEYLLKLT